MISALHEYFYIFKTSENISCYWIHLVFCSFCFHRQELQCHNRLAKLVWHWHQLFLVNDWIWLTQRSTLISGMRNYVGMFLYLTENNLKILPTLCKKNVQILPDFKISMQYWQLSLQDALLKIHFQNSFDVNMSFSLWKIYWVQLLKSK